MEIEDVKNGLSAIAKMGLSVEEAGERLNYIAKAIPPETIELIEIELEKRRQRWSLLHLLVLLMPIAKLRA